MPINRLLKEGNFTPAEVERLNRAFALALTVLRLVDRNDPICEIVASSRATIAKIAHRASKVT
jgi:hypothetical protein